MSVADQASAKNGASACRIRCICAGVTSAFSTLLEARLLGAGDDVLPAVGLEHERVHRGALGRAERRGAASRGRSRRRRAPASGRMPSTAPTSSISSSTPRSRSAPERRASSRAPFELVEDRVLRLLLPVEQEHVLPQRREVRRRARCSSGSAPGVNSSMSQRQREHRPGRLAQHRAGDVVGLRQERVARGHADGGHALEAAEQLLVLQLLVGEAHQRLERDLVAEPVVAAELERSWRR